MNIKITEEKIDNEYWIRFYYGDGRNGMYVAHKADNMSLDDFEMVSKIFIERAKEYKLKYYAT
jgi:hypothetical protein